MLKLSPISIATIDFDIFTTAPLFNTNFHNENILFLRLKLLDLRYTGKHASINY